MTHEEIADAVEMLRKQRDKLRADLAAARQKVEVEHDKYLRAWHHRCKAMSERDEARAKAIEEAARIAEELMIDKGDGWVRCPTKSETAAAIRALAQPQDGEGE